MAVFRMDERPGEVVGLGLRQSNNLVNFPFNPTRQQTEEESQNINQTNDEVVISPEGELMYELSKLVNVVAKADSVREDKIREAKKRLEEKPLLNTSLAAMMLRLLKK